jgi:hypothetical protein
LEFVTLPQEGDGMATNKETLQDHEGRLQGIETQLGIKPPPPTKNKWERSKEWMRANPWVAWPLAITLSLLTIFGGYWLNHHKEWWNHDVDERVLIVLNETNGVAQTLHDIQQTVNATKSRLDTLEPFIQDVIKHQFESASKLPTATLQERLPAVQHLLEVAKEQQVKVDPVAFGRLSAKLQAIKVTTGGFWPAVGGLISYRSFLVGQDVAGLSQSALPVCTDRNPGGMEVDSVKVNPIAGDKEHNNATITIENAKYADCTLTLDSPEQADKINWILKHRMNKITFTHCVIIYRGGPINITMELNNEPRILHYQPKPGAPEITSKVNVSGPTLTFMNCLFEFALPTIPTDSGQSFAKSMLPQNGSSIVLYSFATHS